jgi:tRNA nucleotidyltransferase (CCA-adding enzyme)
LVTKVKRERVGEEISKIMKGVHIQLWSRIPFLSSLGPDPTRGILLIEHLSLYDSIFNVIPPEVKTSLSAGLAPSTSSVKAGCILRSILEPADSPLADLTPIHPALVSAVKDDAAATARLYLAAALTPHAGITYLDKKKKSQSAVECAIRESLKLGTQNHYVDGIPLLFAAAQLLHNPDLTREKFQTPSERVALGTSSLSSREKCRWNASRITLAGKGVASSQLRCTMAVGCALFSRPRIKPTLWSRDRSTRWYNERSIKIALTLVSLAAEASNVIELYNTFVNRVEELDLTNVGDEKPLLNVRLMISCYSFPQLNVFLPTRATLSVKSWAPQSQALGQAMFSPGW